MRGLVLNLVLVFVMPAQAAETAKKTIHFSQENCSYRLSFDPKKVDEARVRATIGLLYADPSIPDREPQILSYADALKVDLPAYRSWCTAEEARLAGLELLPIPGLQDLRQRRTAEHRDRCELLTAEVEAGRGNVDILHTYGPAAQYCDRYVGSLQRNDREFISEWQAFAKEYCHANANKPDCRNSNLQWLKRPDGVRRLRADMLIFGWYNCAVGRSLVNQGMTPTQASYSMQLRDEVAARFLKSLKVKSLGCENAD